MTQETSGTKTEPKLGRTLLEDLRREDLRGTIRRDFKDLKEFMLTEERRKRLQSMGRLKRFLYFTLWLLKSLLMKLTPARRILLALALLLLVFGEKFNISGESFQISFHFTPVSIVLLLFILMLELKDKLLAREELQAGRAVQQALMPPRSPEVPGWDLWLFTRSANEVGGDLLDFLSINEGRFGVALGDVAGKGLKAALLTAKLQATLRALSPDFTSLAQLGEKLNKVFYRYSLPNLFASIVYLELGPNSGVLRLLNAGHIPPLILRGSKVQKMEKGGSALGILPAATFMEQRFELDENELLIAYSDGLTEARNEAGEFFGEQRLLTLITRLSSHPAQRIGEQLVAEIDRFIGEGRVNDDLSIAVVKRVASPPHQDE